MPRRSGSSSRTWRSETAARESEKHETFFRAARDPRALCRVGRVFVLAWCGSVINYWSPTIIRNSGVSDTLTVGLLSAVPYGVGAIGHAGHQPAFRPEARTALALWLQRLCLRAGSGVAALAAKNWQLAIVLLAILSIGYLAGVALFWSIPTAYLSKTAAAGSIALISSIGQLGGLVAPNIIGWTQHLTGDFDVGFYTVAFGMALGTTIMLIGVPARMLRERYLEK